MAKVSKKYLTELIKEVLSEKKADRCLRIARTKYDKPSAYRSGAIVRCRQGEIWKDLKENQEPNITPDYLINRIPFLKKFNNFSKKNDIFFQKVDYNKNVQLNMSDQTITLPQANTSMEFSYTVGNPGTGRYRHTFNVRNDLNIMWPNESDKVEELTFRILSMTLNQTVDKLNYHADIFTDTPEIPKDKLDTIINSINKAYFDFEEFIESKLSINIPNPLNEDESLRKWFSRKGAKGKSKGWVDCNAPDGKGGYKSCGRQEGEKRSKYPACRPTPKGCEDKGKGKTWGKTK